MTNQPGDRGKSKASPLVRPFYLEVTGASLRNEIAPSVTLWCDAEVNEQYREEMKEITKYVEGMKPRSDNSETFTFFPGNPNDHVRITIIFDDEVVKTVEKAVLIGQEFVDSVNGKLLGWAAKAKGGDVHMQSLINSFYGSRPPEHAMAIYDNFSVSDLDFN